MEPRHCGHQPFGNASVAMPPFGQKWCARTEDAGIGMASPGGTGGVLLKEVLWQLQEKEHMALREEQQHQLFHNTPGDLRPTGHLDLCPLMPASERKQLERLCARIPQSQTVTVLTRFRDVLASNDILPWELLYVFKQVLREVLKSQEEGMQSGSVSCHLPKASPPSKPGKSSRSQPTRLGSTPPAIPDSQGREEIPTISSYVDRHLRAACPHTAHRDWSLPYCQSLTYDCPGADGTTL